MSFSNKNDSLPSYYRCNRISKFDEVEISGGFVQTISASKETGIRPLQYYEQITRNFVQEYFNKLTYLVVHYMYTSPWTGRGIQRTY